MRETTKSLDGNEAAARIAFALSEVLAIYPITPSSPMGELSDVWAGSGKPNLFGTVPTVVQMQSEGGVAGAVHGALQAGALTSTFTASQGLLLMIPNMYKIAGELTPAVFHVAARTLATHALSIFGDHSDVMSARQTGWGMLCSNTVQECHDLALVAHAASLESRVPFMHFFDGFRTSHEVNKIEVMDDGDIRAVIDEEFVHEHRRRSLNPDRPVLRGTAQNPDVFFQAREACNPFYNATPGIVQKAMDAVAARTGRHYKLFDYVGAPDADRVIVMMGSGSCAVEEAIGALNAAGEKLGLVKVRLFRPFDCAAMLAALPSSVERIAVLDRTKEPGSVGEPLYQDVVTALADRAAAGGAPMPRLMGVRYGLSSKEFTPAMAAGVFAELAKDSPKPRATIGINDDLTHLSLDYDAAMDVEPDEVVRAVFYGLGADGTVGANKNSVKIVAESTERFAQGYFVYDSKKSGAMTVSHLRFGPEPITSSYLIHKAGFVACHQFSFLERVDVLEIAEEGGVFLLNAPFAGDKVWDQLPIEVQRTIIDKKLRVYAVDAAAVAESVGLGRRINTVMQVCFFALAGFLPRDEAIAQIKKSIEKSYARHGESVVRRNLDAVDHALDAMSEVKVPKQADGVLKRLPVLPEGVPGFVEKVTGMMMAGKGDLLPVSALPVDGTFPTATAKYEKRSIAHEIPIWDADLCTQCGLCSLYCPHAAIRPYVYDAETLSGAPDGFKSVACKDKTFADKLLTYQVAPDDCTGCGLCVEMCPARSKEVAKHKAINMEPKDEHLDNERAWYDHACELPNVKRRELKLDVIKSSQLLEPLFEFSGACAGCGETPYVKLLTQMFGDRLLVANATGCSSIYGGNLPTTPWSVNDEGRGPAWANSLFEDNAEFGFGMRLGVDMRLARATALLERFRDTVGGRLVDEILGADQSDAGLIGEQRVRVGEMVKKLAGDTSTEAQSLIALSGSFMKRSVWIVGGDGWAYDIGYSGVDHVMASGRDVNVLVLDTEVYSNTGGQASKSTHRAAIAKFASGGKPSRKKDLGLLAMGYGSVYVAQVAMGANPTQTLRAFKEAESYDGPSLIIAYSHCIAHGIDMSQGMNHQKEAAASGYWPLYRYDPRNATPGEHPFRLDSRKPKSTFKDFARTEARFAMLTRANPEKSDELLALAQRDVEERFRFYEQMAGIERTIPDVHEAIVENGEGN